MRLELSFEDAVVNGDYPRVLTKVARHSERREVLVFDECPIQEFVVLDVFLLLAFRCRSRTSTDGRFEGWLCASWQAARTDRLGACSQQRCMSSAQAQVRWVQPVLQNVGNRRQKQSRKVTLARTEATLPVRPLFLNGTRVLGHVDADTAQNTKKSENGRSPKVFPDRIVSKSPINNITDYGSRKVQNKCPAQANEVATCGARFRPGYLCFCGPGSEQAWKTMGQGQRLVLLTWNGISSLPMMMSEFITSRHLVFKQVCWHQRQGNLECTSKRAAKQSHSRERGVGEQNHDDLPLLAHLQELYLSVKEFGLILSQELIRISFTQCQRDWLLFFVMVNYPEKKIRRLNSGN